MQEMTVKARIKKLGKIPVEKMSGTTRKVFKQANHRKEEIRNFEKIHYPSKGGWNGIDRNRRPENA